MRAAQSRFMRFSLSPTPPAIPEHLQLGNIGERAQRTLADPRRDLRMYLLGAETRFRDRFRASRQDRQARDRPPPRSDGAQTLVVATPLEGGGWLVARTFVRSPPVYLAQWVIVSVGLAALAIASVVWLTLGRIIRPMKALGEAANRLDGEVVPEPLPLKGPPEVRQLTSAFNDMATRVTSLLTERAQTLAAIGHDLKSPITAMRIRLAMVDDQETQERLTASVDEIQSLVEAALALASGGGADEPLSDVDLSALLEAIAADVEETLGPVSLSAPDALRIQARPGALKRALRNVVENAVRYGQTARVSAEATATGVRVVIDDDGAGIPEADRERIFEPFTRLEASRSRDTGGAGLGLAIAKAAINKLGGQISASAAPSGGARFVVELPR